MRRTGWWLLLAAVGLAVCLPLLWGRLPITTPNEAAEYFPVAKRWFLFGWLVGLATMVWMAGRHSVRLAVAAVVVIAVGMTLLPPLGSGDAYSSVVRSVGVAVGENPFVKLPAGDLVSTWLPGTWREYPTPYGPLWHDLPGWLFSMSSERIALTVFLLRVVGLLAVVASALIVAAAWGGWQRLIPLAPLILFEAVNNAHPEGLMMLFLLTSAALASKRWVGASALAWVLAIAVKPVAILSGLLVMTLPGRVRWRWLVIAGLAGMGVVAPYLATGGIFGGLFAFAGFFEPQTLTPVTALALPLFGLWPNAAGGIPTETGLMVMRGVTAVAAAITGWWWLHSRQHILIATFSLLFVVAAVAPLTLQPWYWLWAFPLLLVGTDRLRSAFVPAIVVGHAVAYLTYATTGGALIAIGLAILLRAWPLEIRRALRPKGPDARVEVWNSHTTD